MPGLLVSTNRNRNEEIKTGYLIPIYLDGVAPGRNAELFKFPLTETLKVVDSDAGRAWYELTKERTDSFGNHSTP
ncbi:hypothetical protein N5V81_13175 [Escherichia coli]|nr:hypothetical protein [Escherichia coli]